MNAFTRLLFAGLAFAGGIVPANQAQTLGVYDSRAIAIAYAGSPRHEALIAVSYTHLTLPTIYSV